MRAVHARPCFESGEPVVQIKMADLP